MDPSSNKSIIPDGTGGRYNDGKLRYDLIEPFALQELVRVFTKGAEKYAPNNWLKGMAWSKVVASLKRHIAAFENGEDFDKETQCYHMAQAAWNAMALTSYYKHYPQGDDRALWIKRPFKNMWLDIDGILADYEKHFLEYLDLPKHHPTDWNDVRFRDHWKDIVDDANFWATIPRIIDPMDLQYPVAGYITSRPCSNELTLKWLTDNGYPTAPIENVYPSKPKSEVLKQKEGIIITLDDSIKNFIDYQANGINCHLMTRPHNAKYDVGHWRVNSVKEFIERIR